MKTGILLGMFVLAIAGCQTAPEPAGEPVAATTQPSVIDDGALAAEINDMAARDQKARRELIAWMNEHAGERPPSDLASDMLAIDRANAARMTEIIDAIGWPTISKVGAEASGNSWLIIQHAVHDEALMQRALALMEPHVGTGEIDDADYALLYDRVHLQLGHPQRYGTQFTELVIDGVRHFGVQPIEHPAHVDERRAEVGLPPLDDYERRIRATYGITEDVPSLPRDMTMDEYNALVEAARADQDHDGG